MQIEKENLSEEEKFDLLKKETEELFAEVKRLMDESLKEAETVGRAFGEGEEGKKEESEPMEEIEEEHGALSKEAQPSASVLEKEPEIEKPELEITDILEMSAEVVSKFNEILGVDYETDKDKLPLPLAFFDLSENQQLLLLENLRQFNLGRVEKRALAKKKEETEELSKTKIYEVYTKKFWKRAGLAIARQYHFKKKAHEAAGEIKEDVKENLRLLTRLLNSVKGVEVEKKDGELVVNFAGGFDSDKFSSSEKSQIAAFNEATRNYLKYSYTEEIALKKKKVFVSKKTRNEKEKFLRAKEEYNTFILNVQRIKQEAMIKQGFNPDQAKFFAWSECKEIQKTVEINRFLNTHPNVEKSLQGIENEPVFSEAVKEALKARGLYAGAGFAGRAVTAGILGFAAAPVVAAGFGAFRAYRNKKLNFKEQEILQRFGLDIRERAGKRSAQEERDLERRARVGDSLALEKIGKEKTVQRFVKANRLSNTINVLLNRIDDIDYKRIILVTDKKTGEQIEVNAADTFNKENLLKDLDAILHFTSEQTEKGLVNFGAAEESLTNYLNLIDSVNRGLARQIRDFHADGEEIYGRMKRAVRFNEKGASKAKRKEFAKHMALGGAIAAGYAEIGALVRGLIPAPSLTEKLREWQLLGSKKISAPPEDLPVKPKEAPTVQEKARERILPRAVEEPPRPEETEPSIKEKKGIVPETKEEGAIGKGEKEPHDAEREETIPPESEKQKSAPAAPEITPEELKKFEDLKKELLRDLFSKKEEQKGIAEWILPSSAFAGEVEEQIKNLPPADKERVKEILETLDANKIKEILQKSGATDKKGEKSAIANYVYDRFIKEKTFKTPSAGSGVLETPLAEKATEAVEQTPPLSAVSTVPKSVEASPNIILKIEKGGNVWNSLKKLEKGGFINREQFTKIWDSKINVNGKEVDLRNLDLIPADSELSYNSEKGIMELVKKGSGALGTSEDLYAVYQKEGKKAPEWLNKKLGIRFEDESKKSVLTETKTPAKQQTEMIPADKQPEKTMSDLRFSPLQEMTEAINISEKDIELVSGMLEKSPAQAMDLLERVSLNPDIFKTASMSGETIWDLEKLKFLSEHIGKPIDEINQIFNKTDTVNKALETNFTPEQIYARLLGKGLNVVFYESGNQSGLRVDKAGYNLFINKNGVVEMGNEASPITSPLSGNLLTEKININELSADTIDAAQKAILEQRGKEESIFGALVERGKVKFGADARESDILEVLKKPLGVARSKDGLSQGINFLDRHKIRAAETVQKFCEEYLFSQKSAAKLDDKLSIGEVLSSEADKLVETAESPAPSPASPAPAPVPPQPVSPPAPSPKIRV